VSSETRIKELSATDVVRRDAIFGQGRLATRPQCPLQLERRDNSGKSPLTFIRAQFDGYLIIINCSCTSIRKNGVQIGRDGDDVSFSGAAISTSSIDRRNSNVKMLAYLGHDLLIGHSVRRFHPNNVSGELFFLQLFFQFIFGLTGTKDQNGISSHRYFFISS